MELISWANSSGRPWQVVKKFLGKIKRRLTKLPHLGSGKGTLKDTLPPEFRKDFAMRRYASAYKKLCVFGWERIERLPLNDQLKCIRCAYGAGEGLKANELLLICLRKAKSSQVVALGECLVESGLNVDKKISLLSELERKLDTSATGYPSEKYRIETLRFQLEESLGLGVLTESRLSLRNADYKMFGACAKSFHLFSSYGLTDHVKDYLLRCLSQGLVIDQVVAVHILHYLPELFVQAPDRLPREITNLSLVRNMGRQSGNSNFYKRRYQDVINDLVSGFNAKNIEGKDVILRFLLKEDLWDLAFSLVKEEVRLHESLAYNLCAGFECLISGYYAQALEHFLQVLREDPSDKLAAQGLRFALPRAGYSIDKLFELRLQFGYGRENGGLRAVLQDGEYVSALMLHAEYLKAFAPLKRLPHWRYLESHLGSRFKGYGVLNLQEMAGKVFVLADSGLGDEIRAAQHYTALISAGAQLIISCDPRMANIFKRSFPSVEFIPVKRIRKILWGDNIRPDSRLVGYHDSVSNQIDDVVIEHMSAVDLVTFGHNLVYNSLMGYLDKPVARAYLIWDRLNGAQAESKKLRLGILWRSNLLVGPRKLMYLKVEDFSPLFGMEGVELWCIQHSVTAHESDICAKSGVKSFEGFDFYNDMEGLASCLLTLDLIVGISSVPMELGAALGIESWLLGFSPENYYLRTSGGKTEVDQLTLNSRVIAPENVDFTQPQSVCVQEVFAEVKRRLQLRLASSEAVTT